MLTTIAATPRSRSAVLRGAARLGYPTPAAMTCSVAGHPQGQHVHQGSEGRVGSTSAGRSARTERLVPPASGLAASSRLTYTQPGTFGTASGTATRGS